MCNSPSTIDYSRKPAGLARFWLLAAAAGLAAGCSADATRLAGPTFTGSTANQQAIIGKSAQYATPAYTNPYSPAPAQGATAASGVVRQPLPAYPAGSASTYQTATYTPPAATVASGPKPYTPPKPYAASGMPTPIGAAASNSLAPQTLNQQAARISRTAPAATARPGGTYRVQSGDSLWTIARAHGTTTNALIAANGLSGSSLKIGQSLVIPAAGSAPKKVQVASIDPSTPVAPLPRTPKTPKAPPVAMTPRQPDPAPAVRSPVTDTVATLPDVSVSPSEGFRWPVRGRIISNFGTKPNGEKNDGINLAVPEGTSVKAAEDGVVIYAGNELKSYGNLVLIRHKDGWVSAYAHNRAIKVKRGEEIRRGQIVSEAGMTGGVTSPQVHFELRKGATPVNPL
ncbi:MAG TPA: peptidoglycan DD-metalloendopeptidase family protein, partial [Afifellaceae bacterium]|nr:peptidoglycan DD-metalloendopeptidase family protein [Afifellaceae bacterium]